MELQFPLEKELNNHVEFLTKEEEDEVQACFEELDGARENSTRHTVFEELKNGRPIEKPKVELNVGSSGLRIIKKGG